VKLLSAFAWKRQAGSFDDYTLNLMPIIS